jgi:putative PIN family toxin of toxin-antitoxin system
MKIRVVLDANIYASALMKSDGPPNQVLRSIIEGEKFELVISQDILDELERVLFYPKIYSRIGRTEKELFAWLDSVSMISHTVVPLHAYPPIVHDDPSDDIYMIASLESQSSYIVTGDQHLLKIRRFEHIQIFTAYDFLKLNS